ncbi:MAG: DUF4395 domain-containing protein [Leptospiraceae bacterium]|jgi:hypothetical protein|nr:DUF4395 domain-containing protein [Leptospiraceae bacterium]
MKTIKLEFPLAIEKNRIRLGALLVFVVSLISILSFPHNKIIFLLLISLLWFDFLLSFVIGPKISIFKPLVERIHQKWIKKEEWISPKPKRFAKFCGLSLLTASLLVFSFNSNVSVFLVAILSLFSFLEAAFDFCVACKMYGILQKIGFIEKDHCENC